MRSFVPRGARLRGIVQGSVRRPRRARCSAAKPGSPSGPAASFPLVAGTFTITNRKGASISGIYSGETNEGGGVSVTKLRLEVQKGTDNFTGASGVLEGKGTGAFTGEGAFVARRLRHARRQTARRRRNSSATLHGDSRNRCDAGRIVDHALHADSPAMVSGAAGEMQCTRWRTPGCRHRRRLRRRDLPRRRRARPHQRRETASPPPVSGRRVLDEARDTSRPSPESFTGSRCDCELDASSSHGALRYGARRSDSRGRSLVQISVGV